MNELKYTLGRNTFSAAAEFCSMFHFLSAGRKRYISGNDTEMKYAFNLS